MKKKYKWFASYDLDGSFEFAYCDPDDPPMFYSHTSGPYNTLAEAKRETISWFRFCIGELKGGISDVKNYKKGQQ